MSLWSPTVGRNRHPVARNEAISVITCNERLGQIMSGKVKLVLDDMWRIIGEYMQNLRSSGEPGVGDAFLRWVLTNKDNP